MYANANPYAVPAALDSPYEDERVAKQTKVIRCVFDLETTGLSGNKEWERMKMKSEPFGGGGSPSHFVSRSI